MQTKQNWKCRGRKFLEEKQQKSGEKNEWGNKKFIQRSKHSKRKTQMLR